MRDALSILDKIVSFTNGDLNYSNTLAHLNILDAEFYFKLLDCMQEQDLAGAMLLYDEINRKGFEGDVVLNGFAEFIRNLLVCKDEKAAALLEAVDSFREKYLTTAKNVAASLLVSYLNILNEAEVNYKAALNKRLHVELALIKLCYLQQAIELSAASGGVSKKKLTDAPVAFRTAPIKLFTSSNPVTAPASKPSSKTNEAKLIIEAPEAEKITLKEEAQGYEKPETRNPKPETTKLSALDKIRKQYQGNGNNGNGNANHPLKQEELQQAWNEYTLKLKEGKNPAAHSFEEAQLRIKDKDSFEVVTADNIERQFIEQDRNRLFAFLQEKLQNKQLQFTIVLEEKTGERPPQEITLSAKEQFLKMAEEYPMVKELKDRLRLELDY